jgi:hypothetical protein
MSKKINQSLSIMTVLKKEDSNLVDDQKDQSVFKYYDSFEK